MQIRAVVESCPWMASGLDIPACHGSALHRTHPQYPLHPTQAVECIHEAAEDLWITSSRIFSRPTQAYPGAVNGKTISHTSSIDKPMPSMTKKALSPTRMQSSRFSTYASKSSEGSSRRKLGDGPEPAAHGRQDVSAYAAIRCCLLNRFTQNS